MVINLGRQREEKRSRGGSETYVRTYASMHATQTRGRHGVWLCGTFVRFSTGKWFPYPERLGPGRVLALLRTLNNVLTSQIAALLQRVKKEPTPAKKNGAVCT